MRTDDWEVANETAIRAAIDVDTVPIYSVKTQKGRIVKYTCTSTTARINTPERLRATEDAF